MIDPFAVIGLETKLWHSELSNIGQCVIGHDCIIHSHVWIGNRVWIGHHCKIQAFTFIPTGVKIGDGVFVGPRVTFLNDKYPPSKRCWQTVVHDKVSIGGGAIILPGIEIGAQAMIGAGSVVTKSIPANETWYGNPARKRETP